MGSLSIGKPCFLPKIVTRQGPRMGSGCVAGQSLQGPVGFEQSFFKQFAGMVGKPQAGFIIEIKRCVDTGLLQVWDLIVEQGGRRNGTCKSFGSYLLGGYQGMANMASRILPVGRARAQKSGSEGSPKITLRPAF